MAHAALLVIEDSEDILANIYDYLEPMGYGLDCARNGLTGLEMAITGGFDCVILDILLPGLDGLSLCRKLREEYHNTVPVIMLTALGQEEDRVLGLDAGADDYLVKPFSLRELEARIRALLRRGHAINTSGEYAFADISINPAKHCAFRQNRALRLSPSAFLILAELVRKAPEVVTRQRLEELLWAGEERGPGALRNHIHELRQILDKPFSFPILQTIPHIGYCLRLDTEA